ncbi:amidohydrolase family protein [Brevundimonas sp.]|jgi:L-fuconolactonase|uniref:amidohydrolase family protein n=1 Tax=Brevundimonas sp. TaxID=1871086 RepID=UPI003783D6C5
MLIDAHQHFWRIGQHGQVWPEADLGRLYRNFEPRDLWALGEPVGLTGVVAVQSQPDDRDTDWLLDLARDEPRILGVVGWVDLEAKGAPDRIATLATNPKIKGLRPMLQALEDDWICRPALSPAVDAMARHGLRLDALVRPRHLPGLLRFAQGRPDIPLILDHGAKPDIGRGDLQGWADRIAPLAALPHVQCKLSGLLTECGPGQGAEAIAPYVGRLFDLFGPDRIVWGSDWPVVELVSPYNSWLTMARRLVGTDDRSVFGANAVAFYGLDLPS